MCESVECNEDKNMKIADVLGRRRHVRMPFTGNDVVVETCLVGHDIVLQMSLVG